MTNTANNQIQSVEDLTLEQRAEMVKNFKSILGANLQVNKSGNIFLRHPMFQSWSVDKQKTYTAGVNIDPAVLLGICTNKQLQEEIIHFLSLLPSKTGMSAEDVQSYVAQFSKPKKA